MSYVRIIQFIWDVISKKVGKLQVTTDNKKKRTKKVTLQGINANDF